MNESIETVLRQSPHGAVARGLKYARDVRGGDIDAGPHIKPIADQLLWDLDVEPQAFTFNAFAAEEKAKLLETFKHFKGPDAGRHLIMSPWQCFFFIQVFGWMVRSSGLRRYLEAFVEVAKKNGKTTLAAAIELLFFAESEGAPEMYCLATGKEQAEICFETAQELLRNNFEFRDRYNLRVLSKKITQAGGGKMEALPAKLLSLDGKNPQSFVADEVGAMTTSKRYDELVTATGSRSQPFGLGITTGFEHVTGKGYSLHQLGVSVARGNVKLDRHLFLLWSIAKGDDKWAEETWKKPNPNWGISINVENFRAEMDKAKAEPAARHGVFTRKLNLWGSTTLAWFDAEKWDALADPLLKLEKFKGKKAYVAIDLASKFDLASMVAVIPDKDEEEWFVFAKSYTCQKTVDDKKFAMFAQWIEEGALVVTPGDSIKYEYIEADFFELTKKLRVQSVGADPWQAEYLIQRIEKEMPHIEVVNYKQSCAHFTQPMKEGQKQIADKRIHHTGDKVLSWCIGNVLGELRHDGVRPIKGSDDERIDTAVAFLMAFGLGLAPDDKGIGIEGAPESDDQDSGGDPDDGGSFIY